jgi:hypothetical protein
VDSGIVGVVPMSDHTPTDRLLKAKQAVLSSVSRAHTRHDPRLDTENRLSRLAYPQTWYLVVRRFPNIKARRIIHRLCRVVGGHEISDTERGYGGDGFVDRHCRWCDLLIRIPIAEMPSDHWLEHWWEYVQENPPPRDADE